ERTPPIRPIRAAGWAGLTQTLLALLGGGTSMTNNHLTRATAFFAGAALLLALAACDTGKVPPAKHADRRDGTETVVDTGANQPRTRSAGGRTRPMASPMPMNEADAVMGRAMSPPPPAPGYWQPSVTSKFPDAKPNPVVVAAEQPVSTFSIDVDTASY